VVNLAVQSFGKETEYRRAILTILSFYAHTTVETAETKIFLFTDKPDFFETYLSGLPVEFVLLTADKIKQMRGEIDFLHRMKIAVIEEAFALCEGVLLYADSDTFFTGDPAPLLQELSEKKVFMHLPEYPFKKEVEDETNTYQNFYALINRQDFMLTNGSRLQVMPEHWSWNAGVMMFHPAHARLIPDVYALTDQFYPQSSSHASEQYAFSLVLQSNAEIKRCDSVIYHYWYRVKKNIVDLFLKEKINLQWQALPLQKKIADAGEWSVQLPVLFKNHVLTIRDNAIQAFNQDKFSEAYKWSVKALIKEPFSNKFFLKDIAYHTKRLFTKHK
jgi:hypothetical protein